MGKKVSLKDIAEKLGVSTAIVSYVLNGQEKEKRVGAELVKQIRETVDEMDYRPNQIARSLRKGSTETIGLIVADIANPFFGAMARVVEDEVSNLGYNLIIGSSDEDSNKLKKLTDTLCNRQVDGFIIVPPEGADKCISELLEKEVPVVLTDRYFPGQNANHVVLDNYSATFEVTSYLVNKGYKQIAMVAYKSSLIHMEERIRGYREAMAGKGLINEIVIETVDYENSDKDVEKALQKLLSGTSSARALIFATNSLTVSGLYYLKDSGLFVPGDVALVGFDGSEAFDFFYSPLTYISQPIDEMAKESVRVLIDQINSPGKIVQVKLKHQFVIRQSC